MTRVVHAIAIREGEELVVLDPNLDPNLPDEEKEWQEELFPLSPTEIALRLNEQGIKASVGWPY